MERGNDPRDEYIKKMNCQTVVSKVMRGSKKILHTKFVLRNNKSKNDEVIKYKARLVVCGNEEQELNEEGFSSVSDFNGTKVLMCLSEKRLAYEACRLSERLLAL